MRSTRRSPIFLLASAAGLAAPCLAQPASFHTIALSGDQAPGQPAGVTFSFFSDPRLSAGGAVAFWAELAGPGVTTSNDGSVWSNRSGPLALVQRESDPAGGNLVLGAFPSPAFSQDGRLALHASLIDTTQQGNPITLAIFAEDVSLTRQLVAQEGQAGPPPFPPPGTWANISPPAMPGSAVSFNANNGAAAWAAAPGQTPAAPAIRGQPAPGTAGNFDFSDQPAANTAGTFVFRATTTDAGASMGLWSVTASGFAPIAVVGTPAPGAPSGASFVEFGLQPTVAAADTVAFWARISGGGVSPAEDTGIWTATPQGLAVVAREGDAVAGQTSLFIGPIGQHPAAGGGTVAFTSNLLGLGVDASNNSGVWARIGGALLLLGREGAQAPRLPSGVAFAGFSEPWVNESGQVMFLARLRGTGVTPASNTVLYSTDTAGHALPLVRTGDFFDVGSGPARMVDEIIFDNDPSSGRTQFIPGGVSIFKLVFRDTTAPPSMALSSGLFTATFRCAADIDGSGQLNINDFIFYMSAFASKNIRAADFTGDGQLNINDFIFFMSAFAAGCP